MTASGTRASTSGDYMSLALLYREAKTFRVNLAAIAMIDLQDQSSSFCCCHLIASPLPLELFTFNGIFQHIFAIIFVNLSITWVKIVSDQFNICHTPNKTNIFFVLSRKFFYFLQKPALGGYISKISINYSTVQVFYEPTIENWNWNIPLVFCNWYVRTTLRWNGTRESFLIIQLCFRYKNGTRATQCSSLCFIRLLCCHGYWDKGSISLLNALNRLQ